MQKSFNQSAQSAHQMIIEINLILESHEQRDHTHFKPHPTNNH